MPRKHARIIQHAFASSLQGALLDSYEEAQRRGRSQIILKVRAVECDSSELYKSQGSIHERLQGHYLPLQLHFAGVSGLKGSDFFEPLVNLPSDDPARTINDMLSWQKSGKRDVCYLLFMHQAENLKFFADHVTCDRLSLKSTAFTLERDWSPPPSMPERLVPEPRKLHQRFGGDPITIHIDDRPCHHRLFIGGTDIQGNERPQVDVVFNVGEHPSRWVRDDQIYPQDRWDNKGEGSDGMTLEVIHEEANWVMEHLKQQNKRVLVHCAAGMNRSCTICCAVLILLEGLTAEQALERVRQHHPWARPDSGHWLKLRWLAEMNSR